MTQEHKNGVSVEELRAAVLRSGYPLQGMVVDKLIETIGGPASANWDIQEEWSFVDGDTNDVRQIDALVSWQASNLNPDPVANFSDPSSFIRVHLTFLIECIQSELPYVAFTRETASGCRTPLLLGLPHEDLGLRINATDKTATVGMSTKDALGTYEFGSRCGQYPPVAVSISKAQWIKGGHLELSGQETYRSLTLPMLKAIDYLKESSRPSEQRMYYDLRLTFPIAVMRAPLFEARVQNGAVQLAEVPLVRAVRSEPTSKTGRWPDTSGFDIVQYDFLADYAQNATNSVLELVERVKKFLGTDPYRHRDMGSGRIGFRSGSPRRAASISNNETTSRS
ncbi:Uncharacterised protein [Nocardia farcinica]|uniref:Uncharacterized protein n=1 Tax=Nocardia farcinica TaxID=37329 RepID=A0A449GC20_NOCFR|nr:hypothetical protein [Nocardia farcinica]VFA95723.1 Uncharacterised protein [Nocardia farcinica]